jgi:hypothetical protein
MRRDEAQRLHERIGELLRDVVVAFDVPVLHVDRCGRVRSAEHLLRLIGVAQIDQDLRLTGLEQP